MAKDSKVCTVFILHRVCPNIADDSLMVTMCSALTN